MKLHLVPPHLPDDYDNILLYSLVLVFSENVLLNQLRMLLVRLVRSTPLRGTGRSFSTSLCLSVRRARQRQEVAEVAEEVAVEEGRWADFVRRRGDVTEERLRVTSFGSMRVDGENVPMFHGQHETLTTGREEEKVRGEEENESIGDAHLVRPFESHRPLLSSLMEDGEGSSSCQFNKYKSFSVKNSQQQDDTRVEN